MRFSMLDQRGAVPLYYQIQQRLLASIRSGALKPGQAMPSELELATRLHVSRMTARQALKALCEIGVAFSERGKGTFVSPIKLEKGFRQILSFTDEMEARKSQPGSRVLSFEICYAGNEVGRALKLSPKQKVVRLRRVRTADSIPMGIECSCVPLHVCPDLLRRYDPNTSLYRTLADGYGVQISVADEIAEAALAGENDAKLLEVAKGSPVFMFTRTSYLQNGQAVEYVKSVYRADRYKIVNRLRPVENRIKPRAVTSRAQRRRVSESSRSIRSSGRREQVSQ